MRPLPSTKGWILTRLWCARRGLSGRRVGFVRPVADRAHGFVHLGRNALWRASKSCSARSANLVRVHRRLTVAIVRVEEGHRRDDAGSCAALACRVVLLARKLLPSIRIEVLTSDLAVSNRCSDILPRRMADVRRQRNRVRVHLVGEPLPRGLSRRAQRGNDIGVSQACSLPVRESGPNLMPRDQLGRVGEGRRRWSGDARLGCLRRP